MAITNVIQDKKAFEHDCEVDVYVGTIVDGPKTTDIYYHAYGNGYVSTIFRLGNDESYYCSGPHTIMLELLKSIKLEQYFEEIKSAMIEKGIGVEWQ